MLAGCDGEGERGDQLVAWEAVGCCRGNDGDVFEAHAVIAAMEGARDVG